ncbi:MAG TPA: hypothetical protein VLB76_08135 [Thermoanaerobaculia bacterium]|jgi:hypothetical protein|nr:hypothetical protein [Thermoanaerobaculia bacterium]
MKARLSFAFAVLAFSVALTPAPASSEKINCVSYCGITRCIEGYTCGPYINSSGQTVCGCHPGIFKP